MTTTRQHPWTDPYADWYAALQANGVPYAVARLRRVPDGVTFEVLSRTNPTWRPTGEGAAYFTELGGVTNAVPIDESTAMLFIKRLTTPGFVLDCRPETTYE
jgi:hypothetical protein